MKVQGTVQNMQPSNSPVPLPSKGGEEDFAACLGRECLFSVNKATAKDFIVAPIVPPRSVDTPRVALKNGVAAYRSQAQNQPQPSSFEKYVDDQLLDNPGGDRYDLKEKKVAPEAAHSFLERVGKDLKDAFANTKNVFSNMLFGAKFCYRDENNQIQEAQKKGLVGSIVDFFKDVGSFVSFGAWRPDGDPEPKGVGGRIVFAFSKLWKAFSTDILQNVPASVNHMAEDISLAGLNLIEAIPDATIGNLPAGEKAVTKVFDGGQVLINYLTDVTPGGDAWQRVHALSFKDMKAPIANNLQKPECGTEDPRWRNIRNTTFRKSIETAGTILADVLTFGFVKWIGSSSEKTQHRN
jgi:hypothetical protein